MGSSQVSYGSGIGPSTSISASRDLEVDFYKSVRPDEHGLWTAQETAQLRELWEQTHDLNSVAKAMNKSVEAVRNKLKRLGLRDDDQLQKQGSSPRDSILPVDIMTHEEVLKILAGAIARLQQPDLEKRETNSKRG